MSNEDQVVEETGTEAGAATESVSSAEPADLRATIESAFEASENEAAEKPSSTTGSSETDTTQQQAEVKPVTEEPKAQQQVAVQTKAEAEAAPKSWRSGAKAKWDTVDPDIKREVLRRERDTERVFNEASHARGFINQFSETVRPYEARLRMLGVNPIEATQRLLQSDYILSSSPPAKAAQYMAKMVKEYGIDIRELDNALAGLPQIDPVQSQVEQVLQARLAPLNQFLQQQQLQQQAIDQQRSQVVASEVEAMSRDTAKFPHFETVRETMADLVEFYAARGKFNSLDEIYATAVNLDPNLRASNTKAAVQQSAAESTAQTRKALAASASVSGSPGGSNAAVKTNGSLRDVIESAWTSHSGR